MTHGRSRWVLTALRLALCAVALVFLYFSVHWHDRIRLRDGSRARLVAREADRFTIERDGRREVVGADDVAFVTVEGAREPDVDPGIAAVVRDIDVSAALFALAVFFPATLLQALRLVWMLAMQDVRLSFWQATKLSYAGNFFNFALPGTTGGDLIKAYYITRFTQHKTEAVTAVFLDRVVGLFGLVMLAGAMIGLSSDPRQFTHLAWVLAFVVAALAAGALFVFSRRLRHLIRLPQLVARLPAGDQLLRVGRATVAMRRHKSLALLALLNTLALQFIVMVSAFYMAQAMGMRGAMTYYLIYVPIGFLIAAIPITPPQAIGVMEYAYVVFFAKAGLASPAQAVAFALAVRLIQLAWALPGILVAILGVHIPSRTELDQIRAPDEPAPAAAP